MKALYILELVKRDEESILSLPTTMERIDRIIEIAKQAPVPDGTPVGFEFFETMDAESSFLIRALEVYKTSGRVIIVPNDFSKVEAEHVTAALDFIYELCEKGTVKEGKGE